MDILSILLTIFLAAAINSDSTHENQISLEAFPVARINGPNNLGIIQPDREPERTHKLANEEVSAYNYHQKIGIPQAERILNYESEVTIAPIISNGSESRLGQNPYQGGLLISLQREELNSVCGCSLISHDRALTAAHCWWDGYYTATSFVVVLGSTTLFYGGTRITTSQVDPHPNWNFQTLMNDIAMIRFGSVALNVFIQPIALPSCKEMSNDWSNQTGVISGYGYTETGTLGLLYNTNLKIITNAECQKTFYLANQDISYSHICAGDSSSTACPGDSGSPLAIYNDNRTVLVGVASFALENETIANACQLGTPVAYTRVSSYMKWIKSLM